MDEDITFLEMNHEKDEKSCNKSQHMKKTPVCNEELNHQIEDEGFQLKFSSCI